jgi:hypothetical protein
MEISSVELRTSVGMIDKKAAMGAVLAANFLSAVQHDASVDPALRHFVSAATAGSASVSRCVELVYVRLVFCDLGGSGGDLFMN